MTDPQHPTTNVTLHHGDSRSVLGELDDCSIDSIVTDPPYELGFRGKKWDASGIAYNVDLWAECLRVLKPGGHLLAFGGTRTYHRMTVAIEDAGFEIRDSIHWTYGSGFPKSLDVSKAIDKAAGAERKVTGKHPNPCGIGAAPIETMGGGWQAEVETTAPATDDAKQWEGWGTALKPSHEPIVLARKPLVGTVAANVLEHGTGALNIDGCRIGSGDDYHNLNVTQGGDHFSIGSSNKTRGTTFQPAAGRWPANIIFDEEAGAELDAQSGITKDGASRFFYCPKPSKRERNAGLDGQNQHPTVKPLALMRYLIRLVTPPNGTILDPFAGSGTTLAAATLEGVNAVGIELTDEYLPIITARCQWAESVAQLEDDDAES